MKKEVYDSLRVNIRESVCDQTPEIEKKNQYTDRDCDCSQTGWFPIKKICIKYKITEIRNKDINPRVEIERRIEMECHQRKTGTCESACRTWNPKKNGNRTY